VLLQQFDAFGLAGAGPDQLGVPLHITDRHPGGTQLGQQRQPVQVAVAEPAALLKHLRERVSISLPQLHGVAVVPVSGLTGYGLDALMTAVTTAGQVWNRRVATADLNRWLGAVQQRHPPPLVAGRRLRLEQRGPGRR